MSASLFWSNYIANSHYYLFYSVFRNKDIPAKAKLAIFFEDPSCKSLQKLVSIKHLLHIMRMVIRDIINVDKIRIKSHHKYYVMISHHK